MEPSQARVMHEAEQILKSENISPPRFPSLSPSRDPFRLDERHRFLDTIDEASTPLSANTNCLQSTLGKSKLRDPINDDLTTILSSEPRMKRSQIHTLSTGANLTPRIVQTP